MRLDSVSLPGSGKSIIRQRAERTGARCSHRAHRARCVPSTSNRGQADGDPRLGQELGPGLGGPPGHPAPASPGAGQGRGEVPVPGQADARVPVLESGRPGGSHGAAPIPPAAASSTAQRFFI